MRIRACRGLAFYCSHVTRKANEINDMPTAWVRHSFGMRICGRGIERYSD